MGQVLGFAVVLLLTVGAGRAVGRTAKRLGRVLLGGADRALASLLLGRVLVSAVGAASVQVFDDALDDSVLVSLLLSECNHIERLLSDTAWGGGLPHTSRLL